MEKVTVFYQTFILLTYPRLACGVNEPRNIGFTPNIFEVTRKKDSNEYSKWVDEFRNLNCSVNLRHVNQPAAGCNRFQSQIQCYSSLHKIHVHNFSVGNGKQIEAPNPNIAIK